MSENIDGLLPRNRHAAEKMFGKEAVAASRIVSRSTSRRCRECDQASLRLHGSETGRNGPRISSLKRVIAARVEDEDSKTRSPGIQPLQNIRRRDATALRFDVISRIEVRRQQIVLLADLNAMAGKVEERDVARLHSTSEIFHPPVERLKRCVQREINRELHLLKRGGKVLRIVYGIREARDLRGTRCFQ